MDGVCRKRCGCQRSYCDECLRVSPASITAVFAARNDESQCIEGMGEEGPQLLVWLWRVHTQWPLRKVVAVDSQSR